MLKIILGGILAVPCLLVTICIAPLIAILAIPPLMVLLLRKSSSGLSIKNNLPDHVIIAGGSSGIGLCIAQECIKLKTTTKTRIRQITLLARNETKLQQAKQELNKLAELQILLDDSQQPPPKIQIHSVSVSDFTSLEQVAASLQINKSKDRVALFNCAGIPYTVEFEKISPEQCLSLIQTNQLGCMFLVKAFLPYLEHGVITLTSSVAAQAAVYGYAAYTPTKCAVTGFAQCLTQELVTTKPNLHIQVAYPADTNTPGYREESQMMPDITKALNETSGLADPSDTAKAMIKAAFQPYPKFAVYFNIDGWALSNLTAGFGPVYNMGDALAQISLLPIFRWVAIFIQNDFWRIIRKMDPTKNSKKGD